MKRWLVIHNVEQFANHPDYIGRDIDASPQALRTFGRIEVGDSVVYYAKQSDETPGYVMDVGVVDSKATWRRDPAGRGWNGTEVRHFKSRFPTLKGGLLSLDELRQASTTVRLHFPAHARAKGSRLTIEINDSDFGNIVDAVCAKFNVA